MGGGGGGGVAYVPPRHTHVSKPSHTLALLLLLPRPWGLWPEPCRVCDTFDRKWFGPSDAPTYCPPHPASPAACFVKALMMAYPKRPEDAERTFMSRLRIQNRDLLQHVMSYL